MFASLILPVHALKGPRYCPSLEAKVTRFGHKGNHTVWLEHEGYDSGLFFLFYYRFPRRSVAVDLIYPNGLSCSMPEELQESMIRTVPGLENAHMVKPAYGVEYDYVDPRELKGELQSNGPLVD